MRTTMKRPVAARVLSGAALVLTLTACSSGSGAEDSSGREDTAEALAPVPPSIRDFLRTTRRRAVAGTGAAPRDRRRR